MCPSHQFVFTLGLTPTRFRDPSRRKLLIFETGA